MTTYSGDELTALPKPVADFLTERHLATLTTTRADGTPQVTPVGVTYDSGARLARVITWSTSFKAQSVGRHPRQAVAVCQVDGGRWLTIYGSAITTRDPERVAIAEAMYAARYRQPKERDDRVVIEISVNRIVGRI